MNIRSPWKRWEGHRGIIYYTRGTGGDAHVSKTVPHPNRKTLGGKSPDSAVLKRRDPMGRHRRLGEEELCHPVFQVLHLSSRSHFSRPKEFENLVQLKHILGWSTNSWFLAKYKWRSHSFYSLRGGGWIGKEKEEGKRVSRVPVKCQDTALWRM